MVQPFLKWAGGKRWLVQNHADLFPKPTEYNRYIEPFLGSGAVFFHLQPKDAIISDVNPRLINCYVSIRNNYKLVEQHLRKHHYAHDKNYYYSIRQKKFRSKYQQAAQFLYLNRTCWNGLYRENLKGQFNVPIGSKTNAILITDNFKATATALYSAKIYSRDFEETIDEAEKGDFVFIDPPYTVAHNNNGFVKYNQTLFSWDDQVRLKIALQRASKRGAEIVITNANHASVSDLYEGLGTHNSLSRRSVISGNNKGRNTTTELVITI